MEKKEAFGLSIKIIFAIICISILDSATIKILPPRAFLFIWYSCICWFFYSSIWGDLAEHSYNSAKNVRFPFLTGGNRTLEEYTKIWKFFAIFFFAVCTIAFILGLSSPIVK
ncbi:MAG: hypothetical protein WC628_04295 [Candidatus Omnitrophota bacterium]